MVDDTTKITIMRKDGRHIVGHWYEDAILKNADIPARMFVLDVQKNTLDVME